MDIITRLVLLWLCAGASARGEALARLLARRRDVLEAYASTFAREYEPYVFAAVPLHAPVPVLRVLSRAPLAAPRARDARDARPAASAHHAVYARPYETIRYYPRPDLEQEESSLDLGREYARPAPQKASGPAQGYDYATEYESYAPRARPPLFPRLAYALAPYDTQPYAAEPYAAQEAAAPAVLYARPTASGGYTYRRAPAAAAAASRKVPVIKEKEPPFIIKIHKYRIVKDDLI